MNKLTLPGDPPPSHPAASMLRVNHAGEYGAVRIYQGQLAVLKHDKDAHLIAKMKQQEQKHLDFFNHALLENKVRPSIFHPLWHMGGYALGALSAIMGKKYAFACTVAVEEVISQHYQEQLTKIQEPKLKAHIAQFLQEELEHQDISIENKAAQAPGYNVFTKAIGLLCRVAIGLAKRC